MIPLFVSVLLAVMFGHVMKLSGHRNASLLWVSAINYAVASACAAVAACVVRANGAITFTIVTGAWGGVCYLVSLLLYFAAIEHLGMGLATSANRLAVAVPVAAAFVVWRETLHVWQAVGIVLVVLSLPLLGNAKLTGGTFRGSAFIRVLVPMFAITGAGQLANRVFSGGAPETNQYLFLAALFGAAFVAACVALCIRTARLRPIDAWLGALLGLVNFGANVFLLIALRQLPSSVVFSVSSAGSVLLAVVTGCLIWGEMLGKRARAGTLIATLAVVLLTI